ncbi:MAG: transposase [Clostridia bacterium]
MELPKRKSIRLKNYDYSQNGAYFITICTHNKECILGEIDNGIMNLSALGQIVVNNIKILSNIYDDIEIDKYVVMPNHIHIIISVCRECIVCIPPDKDKTKMLISKIVQIFKSSVTKEFRLLEKTYTCNQHVCNRYAYNAYPTMVWQKSFHDHIIRNEQEYQKIWEYIDTNPLKWELDCYHIK